MTTTTTHGAAGADIPASVGQFQRAPEPELPYGFWPRLSDTWAGWRDRTVIDVSDGEVDSAWVQRLHFACWNRLEAEHRTAQASLALLDHAIVGERQRIITAKATAAELTETRDRLAEPELSTEPITVAERSDDPAVRLARRGRDRAARLAALDAQVSERRAMAYAADLAVQTLTAARHAHWAVLQVRGSHLIAYYNRRAATYVRAATRTHEGRVRTPTVPAPTWLGGPVPPTPVIPREDQ